MFGVCAMTVTPSRSPSCIRSPRRSGAMSGPVIMTTSGRRSVGIVARPPSTFDIMGWASCPPPAVTSMSLRAALAMNWGFRRRRLTCSSRICMRDVAHVLNVGADTRRDAILLCGRENRTVSVDEDGAVEFFYDVVGAIRRPALLDVGCIVDDVAETEHDLRFERILLDELNTGRSSPKSRRGDGRRGTRPVLRHRSFLG